MGLRGPERSSNGTQTHDQDQEQEDLPKRLQNQSEEHQKPPHARRLAHLKVPCFFPMDAWHAPGGGITFNRRDGWSDRPLAIPCARCIGCKIEKSKQWAIRCVHESQLHDRNSFLTLTYNEAHLPKDGSLNIRHWQLFAKRLRQRIGPFRFFHCGEYGEKNHRPHYHACIFGVDFRADQQAFKKQKSSTLYTSKLLEDVWGKGFCTIGEVTFESAAYVARYLLKKITGDNAAEHYQGRKPEYITMSRNPGIGSDWFKKYRDDVYPSDEIIYKGRRFRPPRYYDAKLTEEEQKFIKGKRQQQIKKRGKDLTPERLIVREKVLTAKTKQLDRLI